MNRCSVKPYEGKEGYIFISYSHRDKKLVFPIIERLAYDGYRIWYDEGINPGSEWPEIIANHLNDCAACMAFITENYLKSHNCRREINFALMKKKPFVTVVLEPVVMSPGMELQLSVTQSVFKYVLPTEDEFYSKLYEAKFLVECLGQPDRSIRISRPEEYDENWSGGLFSGNDYVKQSFRDEALIAGAEDNAANSRELLSGYEQEPVKKESGAAMTFMPPAPKTYQPQPRTSVPEPAPNTYEPQPRTFVPEPAPNTYEPQPVQTFQTQPAPAVTYQPSVEYTTPTALRRLAARNMTATPMS